MFLGILLDTTNQLSNDVNNLAKRWWHCNDQEGISPYLLEYCSIHLMISRQRKKESETFLEFHMLHELNWCHVEFGADFFYGA